MEIAASQDTVCGRFEDGAVKCRDVALLLGSGPEGLSEIAGLRGATDLASRHRHLCAVVEGAVRCVGSNRGGQVGQAPSREPQTEPVTISLPGLATAVSVQEAASCALLANGAVYCWGTDLRGQLGRGRALRANDRALRVRGSGS